LEKSGKLIKNNKMKLLTPSVVVLLLTIFVTNGHAEPPYQVSIRLYDNFNSGAVADSFVLCSGAIIHPFFVLTTAHCMHSHIFSQGISRPLSPNMIYLVAGNLTNRPLTVKYVNGIFIHNNYNDSTYEDDIALLKLEQPFDLKNSNDLKWLELPDNTTRANHCFVSLNRPSSKEFTLPLSVTILDHWFCDQKNWSTLRKDDYCADYYFNDNFMCSVPENQLKSSNDRGAPLICNYRLVGLLSAIKPRGNDTETTSAACAESLNTVAYYTSVTTHVKWIHSIIGINLPASADGKPAPIVPDSPPYQAPPAYTTAKPPKGSSAVRNNLSEIILLLAVVTWVFAHHSMSN